MTEFEDTVLLANKILDRISADPDDDLAMLSRQFLRAREEIERLRGVVEDLSDHGVAAERMERLKAQGKEIERLKNEILGLGHRVKLSEYQKLQALLTRAADALEFWMKDLASTEQQYVDAAIRDERLLSELRKAAE